MSDTTPERYYDPKDNVYQRLARFSPRLNMLFDELFKGMSRAGREISWEYLSIHAIRGRINREAYKYGLFVNTRAQAPKSDMLPEDAVERAGQTFARAWQNAIVRNIDDPSQLSESEPTSGEALYTDDKAMSRAKQQAAKTALVALLNIAAGIDSDVTVGLTNPVPEDVKPDNLLCKLQTPQIARFRELLKEQQLEEAPTIAKVSRGKANRLDHPLAPSTIRELMTALNVSDDKISTFIDKLIHSTDETLVPEQQFDERNAALTLSRHLASLTPQARQTWLTSNNLKPEYVAKMNDRQASRYIPRILRFIATTKTSQAQPASRRAMSDG
jgi:hypothetical protein